MQQDMLIEEDFQIIQEKDLMGKGDITGEPTDGIAWSRLTIMQENDSMFNNSNRRSMLKFKNFDSYIHDNHQLVYFVELRRFLRKRGNKREKPL